MVINEKGSWTGWFYIFYPKFHGEMTVGTVVARRLTMVIDSLPPIILIFIAFITVY